MVHELGQLGGTKEFFDCCHYRTNVNQRLRRDRFDFLNCHTFTNNTFHTSQTNTELVLQQFTYATKTTVTQVVDIICVTCAIHKVEQVRDVSNHVFTSYCAVIEWQVAVVTNNFGLYTIVIYDVEFSKAFAIEYMAICYDIKLFFPNLYACIKDYFASFRIYDRLSQCVTQHTLTPAKFFVQFITTNARQVITACIEEQVIEQVTSGLYCWRLAWAQFFIDFN